MKICITNDDGIFSEGITLLAEWAKKLGEVVIVAPKVQQSGKAHSIEIHKAFEVKRVEHPTGLRAYSVDSTPADCVRIALVAMQENFDIVFSGINCGYNLGREIIYSGTVGAALEAGMQQTKGVAFSTGFDTFEGAQKHLDTAWDYIMQNNLLSKSDVWNVNIPEEPSGEIRMTHQGGRFFSDDFIWDGNMIRSNGQNIWQPTEDPQLDTNAVLHDRCISITPLTTDKTNWAALK
ncbi:MAG: 5'/3'-nucleotidase SurE [Clostridia bacterium]|nr:5'/3'-nucleotidase SurE [Clostridia bacterium]